MFQTPIVPLINLDWLAFSVTLSESVTEKDNHEFSFNDPPAGYRLFELTGTNIYRRRFICYNYEGHKIFTLLCCPYSRVIAYDSALVEVANQWLYLGFDWLFKVLYAIHPYSVQCLSRLDLAADFECTKERMAIIKQLAVNDAYIQGKREGSQFHDFTLEITGIERVPRCLSWGSKHSNIKWKLYNKSLEIHEVTKTGRVCKKPYIAECWHQHGMRDDNIWRLEVSITPAAKFAWNGDRLRVRDVLNMCMMEDMYISLYMTRWVCRKNQGHRDKTNDKRLYLLGNFGQVDRVRQWENPNGGSLPVVEYAAGLNAAMLQLEKVEVQANIKMAELWRNTAIECCKLGNLEGYFHQRYGIALETFINQQN